MNDCACGKPVHLRVFRVTINRKRGVCQYIEHADGSALHEKGWECLMLKPYPKNEADRPRSQMVARWNAANQTGPATTTEGG